MTFTTRISQIHKFIRFLAFVIVNSLARHKLKSFIFLETTSWTNYIDIGVIWVVVFYVSVLFIFVNVPKHLFIVQLLFLSLIILFGENRVILI